MEEILFLVNKDLPKVGGIVRWLLKNGITFNVTKDLSSIAKNIKNSDVNRKLMKINCLG